MSMKKLVSLRKSAFISQSGLCYYCSFPMWEDDVKLFAQSHKVTVGQAQRYKCTAEHLEAKSEGGLDVEQNIVAACLFCNLKRHHRKIAPAPDAYRRLVQKRLSMGRWHLGSSNRIFMVPPTGSVVAPTNR